MKLIAFNPMISRFPVFSQWLAAPIFGLLAYTATFNNFFPPSSVKNVQISQLKEEPCSMPGSDTTFTLSCRQLALNLYPYDEDGNGVPDSAYAILYPIDLVDTELSSYPDDVVFSVNRAGEEPDEGLGRLLLSCPDVGTVMVEVYAWRQDSIVASCSVEVLLRETIESCGAPYPVGICGYFSTPVGYPSVYGVQVFLSGDTAATTLTDSIGVFRFLGLEEGNTYLATPYKNTDPGYNVSLFDMVLINKHILGVQLLNDPYKLIAADVNNSGGISGLDLIALRRVLLGVATSFPNNTSWRFIDRRYVFPDPKNPWLEPFPETMLLSAQVFYGSVFCAEFYAIKVGDVNGN